MSDQNNAAPAALSATVLLLRDGDDGLEVLMVERHREIDFASGALVFPGGRLDPGDTDQEARALCTGVDALSDDEVGLRICGIRETFEEAGVLLAREIGQQDVLGGPRADQIRETYRSAVHAGEIELREVAAREGLRLACDQMVPFAHWITPAISPKRFDTMFYITEAPASQLASHDHIESVDSLWVTPAAALKEQAQGNRTIVFATRLNLAKLGESTTVAAATTNAQTSNIVTVEPTVDVAEGGRVFNVPAEAGYGGDAFFDPIIPDWDPRGAVEK